ncbi:MAG: hypothetical protein ACRERE_08340 [Candidatus Entotheonellia bacterium]
MSLTPEQRASIAAAYAPIFVFHPDEQFTLVRPEVYIEQAALWEATPPSDKETDWGLGGPGFPRRPTIPKRGISLDPAHDLEGGADPDGDGINEWYLGHRIQDRPAPYLVSNDERGLWLDSAAWAARQEVTDTSINAICNTAEAARRWRDDGPCRTAGDWYYAEVQELVYRKFKRYFANDHCCRRTSFPLRWNSCRTLAVSRARKLKRSVSCRASAPVPGSAGEAH